MERVQLGSNAGQPDFEAQRLLRQAQMLRAAYPDAAPGSTLYHGDVPPIERTKPSFRRWLDSIEDRWDQTPIHRRIGLGIGTILAGGSVVGLIVTAPK